MKKSLVIKVWVLGILVIAGVLGMRYAKDRSVKEVRVASIIKEDISEGVRLEGTIVSEEVHNIYSDLPLVVDQVLVSAGEQVKKGDILVSFTKGSLGEIDDKLRGMELDLRNAKLELADLHSGSMKLDLDSRRLEIERLENELISLERSEKVVKSELENLRQEEEVKVRLLEKDGISSREVNSVTERRARKELEYESIKNETLLLVERRSLSISGVERLRRELDIQRNILEGKIEKIELSVAQLKGKHVEKLVAPMDGIVSEIGVMSGTPVNMSTKILTLVDQDKLIVAMDIPVSLTKAIGEGMDARIVSRDGFDEKEYTGKVLKISNVTKIVSDRGYEDRVLEAMVEIDSGRGLIPGALVEVDIAGSKLEMVEVVESFSVIEEGRDTFVYVVEDEVVKKMPVELGIKTLSKYQVLNLVQGTEIVLNPFTVNVGDRVKVVR